MPELKHLENIRLSVEATLDCGSLTVEELRGIGPRSVIKTRSAAGDQVDIRVAGELIGHGEIIVVDNRLAVRLSELNET